MDPRHHHSHRHHRQPPSPFQPHGGSSSGGGGNMYPSPIPSRPPRLLDPPHQESYHNHPRIPPFPHPLPPPPPLPPQEHHQVLHQRHRYPHDLHPDDEHIYFHSHPDHARFLIEKAAAADQRNMERFVFGTPEIPPPRVADRIVFPDGHPEARMSRSRREMFEWNRVIDDEVGNIRVRVFDDGRPPFRLEEKVEGGIRWDNVQSSSHREILPHHRQLVEGGSSEIVGRKRRRREEDCILPDDEDDNSSLLESYDARSQRKAGFWGNGYGYSRDTPFEREPSEASSHSHSLSQSSFQSDRYRDTDFLFARHPQSRQPPASLDDSEVLEKSRPALSDTFAMENSHGFQEKWFTGKGRKVLFGEESSRDAAAKKPSVLSRIQFGKPVWKRLEEQQQIPSSPPHNYAISDQGRLDNPVELDADFNSNALVAKEVLVPPCGDVQNYDGKNGTVRTPKKEVSSNDNRKASVVGIPKKNLTTKVAVSSSTGMTKKYDGKVAPLRRFKKIDTSRTSGSPKIGKLKSNGNIPTAGCPKQAMANDTSKFSGKKSNPVEFPKEIVTKETLVTPSTSIKRSGRKVITLGTPKEQVPKNCSNAQTRNSNEQSITSISTSKEKVPKNLLVSPGKGVIKSGDSVTAEGIPREEQQTTKIPDSVEEVNPDQVFKENSSPDITTQLRSDGNGLSREANLKEMSEEVFILLANGRAHSGGEINKGRAVNVRTSREIMLPELAGTNGKSTPEETSKMQGILGVFSTSVLNSDLNASTTIPSSMKGSEIHVSASTSMQNVGGICSSKGVEDSSVTPGHAANFNGNVGSAARVSKKRKRKKKEKVNPIVQVSSGPSFPGEPCKMTLSISPPKDSTHSEGTLVLQSKNKKKKKKLCIPPNQILLGLNPIEETCYIATPSSSHKEYVHSEKEHEELDAPISSISPKDLKHSEKLQELLISSSPQMDLNLVQSGKTLISDSEFFDSLTPELCLKNPSRKSPERTPEAPPLKENLDSPMVEDASNCGTQTHSRKEDNMFPGARDNECHSCELSLPAVGDVRQFVPPVETTSPFCAGDALNNGIITGGRERVQLQAPPPSLEAITITAMEDPTPINIPTALKELNVMDEEKFNGDNSAKIENIKEEDPSVQGMQVLLPFEVQDSILVHSSAMAEREDDDRSLAKNGLPQSDSLKLDKNDILVLSTSNSTDEMDEMGDCTSSARLFEMDSQELAPSVLEQSTNICSDSNISINSSFLDLNKPSVSEPVLGSDKTALCDHLALEKRMPSLSQGSRRQPIGSSQAVKIEESARMKDRQNYVMPRAVPHRPTFSARPLVKVNPSQNARHRTWRRIDPSRSTQPVGQPKLHSSSSLQRQSPKKLGRLQGSYVRKGNSLIRKSSTVAPPPRSSPGIGTSTQGVRPEKSNTVTFGSRVDNVDHMTCSKMEVLNPSIEKPKTPPLPLNSNLPNCTVNPRSYPYLLSDDPPSEAGSEDKTNSFKVPNLVSSTLQNPSFSKIDNANTNNSKRMIYVKHRSNQLVAATMPEVSNSSSQISDRAQPVPSAAMSALYFFRKKNQLIRDTSSGSHLKQEASVTVDTSNTKHQRAFRLLPSKDREGFASTGVPGNKLKQTRSSLVWRLNGVQPLIKDATSLRREKVLPCIFPWKRPAFWRTSLNNISNKRSLTLMSRKLQLSRKRDTIYTVSKGGFTLRKSGVLSIGGSNLKWSKSIEKQSKKVNEEATLAVAEVERKKREQKGASRVNARAKNGKRPSRERIFRVGSVRYKMDSSRRSLVRIPDEQSSSAVNHQSGPNATLSFVPRRLLIGHDEYVRVGSGNKLVRDPKKLVRILASEKVRWSLHTARLRLARKGQYCQFFTRFGKCRKEDGKCPYIHDPTKVAICTKFLIGSCSSTNCKLTHQVIPERMPDCSYFLLGLCTNTNCPYRHVNVNPDSSVCEGFLKGYCSKGDECRKKHSYVCPDFEATGKCLQGTACKLHHRKNQNKSKKKKKREVQTFKGGRYFGSNISEVDRAKVYDLNQHTEEKSEDIFFCEGHFAEYISLNADNGDSAADRDDPMDSHPTPQLDFNLADPQSSDIDALIKPVRIMIRNST